MIVEICADTNPGLARHNNEDSVAYDADAGVCVLADGMGGHNAGEVASGMATAFIKSEMPGRIAAANPGHAAAELEASIVQCVADVNRAIFNMSRGNPNYGGMGTTLVVGVFYGDNLVLGHIGDSRCYRLREGELQQITKDHSVQQEQVDMGLITPEQALGPMRKNIVTRAVGVDEVALIEINQHRILAGDLYLMCSDGLSDMVDSAAIAAALLVGESLEEKAKRLIHIANEAGGRDNISVLLAKVLAVPEKRRLLSSARGAIRRVLRGR
jgi:serine/threonine protein phosphatase PrpC